jgi:hypothetical protein
MADESKAPAEGASEKSNDIQQVKSEFSRKTDNILKLVEEQNRKMNDMVQAIIANQTAKAQESKAAASSDDELAELAVTNPAEFARRVKESAKQEIRAEQTQQYKKQTQEQRILGEMVSDYPELNDRSSELYQEAVKVYEKLSDEEKTSPLSMKTAIRDAAAELGLVPAKKRQTSTTDDFSVSGSSSQKRQDGRGGKGKLSDNSLTFAKLLGRPVDDPKYIESLQNAAKRTNWNKYRGAKDE